MNYRKKYQLDFINAEGTSCRVDFYKNNYDGGLNYLTGGSRPFVLREFNTDLDFYKPIRPQQAEIEILADNVTIEEFIAMDDTTWKIQFYVDTDLYWSGWLLQDDFQEDWINTAHIITLRATEGLGSLKNVNLTYQAGQYTFFEYIGNAVTDTAINTIYNAKIVNNLFYTGMTDGVQDLSLAQAYINNNTFETGVNTYEDYNSAIEKINKAWNMTIFQYQGVWWVVRMSEYLLGANIRGVVYTPFAPGGNDNFLKKFDAAVGVNERIKPIVPNMLRTLSRPVKTNKIIMKYEYPAELICNETFSRGSKIFDGTTYREYNVDCWTHKKLDPGVASHVAFYDNGVAPSKRFYRRQELNTDGQVTDDYTILEGEGGNVYSWVEAESSLILNAGDILKVEFDRNYNDLSANNTSVACVAFWLKDVVTNQYWWVDLTGTWNQDSGPYTRNLGVTLYMNQTFSRYSTFDLTTKPAPVMGEISFILVNPSDPNTSSVSGYPLSIVRNLKLSVTSVLKRAISDYDQLTQDIDTKNKYEEQTYFDDVDTPVIKGSIFSPTDVLTGDRWYRYGVTESLTFKRQKALAHWQLNKRYRSKLDVNMFGLMWDDAGTLRPIGLANTFVFTDDDPSKQWMILNLQEIDFAAATWKATLIEVYDSEIDTPEELVNYPEHTYDFIYE